jgi:hypothetical protein
VGVHKPASRLIIGDVSDQPGKVEVEGIVVA